MQLGAPYHWIREVWPTSDLPAQVEGKDWLRNDFSILQVVEDWGGPLDGEAGVGQAQDAIIRPIFHGLPGQIRAQAKCLPRDKKFPDPWEERVPT